jgi:hypothetical protein
MSPHPPLIVTTVPLDGLQSLVLLLAATNFGIFHGEMPEGNKLFFSKDRSFLLKRENSLGQDPNQRILKGNSF